MKLFPSVNLFNQNLNRYFGGV